MAKVEARAGTATMPFNVITPLGNWVPCEPEDTSGHRELSPGLTKIERAAKKRGLQWYVVDLGERLELRWVSRLRGEARERPRGTPVPIIWRLCDYADRTGQPIWLEVIDGPALVRYYRRFGFRVSRDYGNGDDFEMIREPRR